MERAAPVKHPVSPKRPEADTCSRTGQPEVLFWQDSGGKSPLLKPGACVPGFNRKERPRLGTLPSMPPARTRRMTGRCSKFAGKPRCFAKQNSQVDKSVRIYLPVSGFSLPPSVVLEVSSLSSVTVFSVSSTSEIA